MLCHAERWIDEVDKSVQLVNPVIEVVLRLWIIAWLSTVSRETIWTMHGPRYMYKGKVEGENWEDPTVDCCAGVDIGIVEHTFNVASVDFHNEISDANEVMLKGAKCADKAIKFKLWLQEARFSLIESDGTEACVGPLLQIFWITLTEEVSNCDCGHVNCENDRSSTHVVEGFQGRAGEQHILQVFLCHSLRWTPFEWSVFVSEGCLRICAFRKVLDKNTLHSDSAQECANIREICTRAPIPNFSNLWFIGNPTVVHTAMTNDHYFRCAKCSFISRELTTTILHVLYDAVMSLASWYDSIPFHFRILVFLLQCWLTMMHGTDATLHASLHDRERIQCSIFVKSLLLAMPLIGNV